MRQLGMVCVGLCTLTLCIQLALAISPTDPPTGATEVNLINDKGSTSALTSQQAHQFKRGRDLFNNETFDGNGRTCATCHIRDSIKDNFDFTPEDAQALFNEDPTGPLFRAIDSDDGDGQDYSTLLNHALVKLPFVLPSTVTVDELNSPLVEVDASSGDVTVRLWRSTPSIENVVLEENLMWDGRFGSDLELQVLEAVQAHYEPGRLPTDEELEDIAFFQSSFFTNKTLKKYARGFPPPSLPKVSSGSKWAGSRVRRDILRSVRYSEGLNS